MADVADATGVSRQTVYNEFDGKAGLAQALASAEIDGFVATVRADLFEHGPDVRQAAQAAILHALTSAAGNPLIKAILTSARGGADELLPYLTTRSELVLTAATAAIRDWARSFLPELDEAVVVTAAELVVRLTVSHIVLPSASPERTAGVLADVLVRMVR